MKYLKKFEGSSESFFPISPNEFDESTGYEHDDWVEYIVLTKWVDFNNIEVNQIKSIFNQYVIKVGYHFEYRETLQDGKNSDMGYDGFLAIVDKSNPDFIPCADADWSKVMAYVIKTQDEWFYVYPLGLWGSENAKCYKCDQFDGLVDCLKSIIRK